MSLDKKDTIWHVWQPHASRCKKECHKDINQTKSRRVEQGNLCGLNEQLASSMCWSYDLHQLSVTINILRSVVSIHIQYERLVVNSSVVSAGVSHSNWYGWCTLETQIAGLGLVDLSPAPHPPFSRQVLQTHGISPPPRVPRPQPDVYRLPSSQPHFVPSNPRLCRWWCALYYTCINQAYRCGRHCNLSTGRKGSSILQAEEKIDLFLLLHSETVLAVAVSLSKQITIPRKMVWPRTTKQEMQDCKENL